MHVQTWGMVEHETKAPYEAQAPSITVKLTEEEIDKRGGHGVSIGAIDVNRADGKTARFWVSVVRTNRGQIKAEIRANRRNNETAKQVTGVWLDYEARARGEE